MAIALNYAESMMGLRVADACDFHLEKRIKQKDSSVIEESIFSQKSIANNGR